MENMKNVVSYILIFSILLSGLIYVKPTEIHAKTTIDNFDLSKYRADEYLKKGSVCNNTIKNLLKDENLPSQVIVRDLNSKGFKASVVAWETAHLLEKSPYEIAQGEIDKKGYYEAILLSIFISESKLDNSLWDMGKTVSAETNQILSSTKSWVKKADEIGIKTLDGNQKISKLSSKQKKELKNHLEELFRKQHSALSKSSDIAEVFNEVFSSVDTVYDAVNKMAYYTNACELSNQTKNLIQLMYQDCPKSNLVMKEALRELKVSLDEFNSGVKAEIQSVVIDQASKVLSTLADAGWEKVINANPYVAAFSFGGKFGTKIGDSICNTLFSTDKTIEQYEKMKCLGEFHALLSSSTQKLGRTYLKKRTSVNAENYLASIDALFATANLSCKFGIEYADILYQDAALGWTAISNKSYTKFLSDIKSIQKTYADEQKSLVRNYLASLKVDFPAIYKTIVLAQDTYNKVSEDLNNTSSSKFQLSDLQYKYVKGTWEEASSGGWNVKFTRSKVKYYDRKSGKVVWTADIKKCKKIGKSYIYYVQSKKGKYEYRTIGNDSETLEYYCSWDDKNIGNYYSGSSSLSRIQNSKSNKDIIQLLLNYYNALKDDDGTYVVFDNEISDQGNNLWVIVRYQMTDAESNAIEEAGGFPAANIMVSGVTINKTTGIAEDEYGNIKKLW